MSLWKIFGPRRQVDFFELLSRQAEKSNEGVNALLAYLESGSSADMVKKHEQESDDVRRLLIDELNQTFMTPIDREDIFALSRAIDDIVDYANNTVKEMEVFEVGPNDRLIKMGQILKEGSEHICQAVRHLHKNPSVANEYSIKAKRSENAMNREYLEALNELFFSQDLRLILSLREIYRHLNRSADRVDDAANIINNIVVKLS